MANRSMQARKHRFFLAYVDFCTFYHPFPLSSLRQLNYFRPPLSEEMAHSHYSLLWSRNRVTTAAVSIAQMISDN